MKNRQLITATVLVAGILLLVNLLAREYSLRLDFTADKRYTLNKVTKDILKELTDPITVTVYFSKDLPPQYSRVRREFKETLQEYGRRSGGKLVYEIINPNESKELADKALKDGIQPLEVNIREKDQAKAIKAYMGAIVQMGQAREILPVVLAEPIEYALTTRIKKLTTDKKPKVAFLQGHKEPPLALLTQLNQILDISYTPQALFLTDTTKISEDIRTIVIIAPKDTIPPSHFKQLDAFMAKGGNIAVAVDKVNLPRQLNQPLVPIRNGLETWLKTKGVSLEDKVVIDAQCNKIAVPRQIGNLTVQSEVQFPYFPILSKFSSHPAAQGLDAVLYQFATPLKFNGNPNKTFTPLAYTSAQSGVLPIKMPVSIEQNFASSFTQPRQVVAAALEDKAKQKSRMVIFANGGFVAPQQRGQTLNQDNINFMANSIDWLQGDTKMIELRTKQVQYRPLRKGMKEGFKAFIKYFNLLFPMLLVIGYGFYRSQKRKAIRRMRMSLTAIKPESNNPEEQNKETEQDTPKNIQKEEPKGGKE